MRHGHDRNEALYPTVHLDEVIFCQILVQLITDVVLAVFGTLFKCTEKIRHIEALDMLHCLDEDPQ